MNGGIRRIHLFEITSAVMNKHFENFKKSQGGILTYNQGKFSHSPLSCQKENVMKSTTQEGLLAALRQEWEEKLRAGETIWRILYQVKTKTERKLRAILLLKYLEERLLFLGMDTEEELKKALVDTICCECDFSPEQLQFWIWLIQSRGLQNN